MEYRSFLDFLNKAEKLKCNTRHSWTSSGRHESVAEHSWRLALMAMLLGEQFSDLDRNKVIKMCLIHDLGEAVTGDIPAFVKTEKDEAVESKAVSGLFDTLPETQKKEMTELFAEMNALETREAKLYKSLDKLEALIQHNEADLATWLPLEYDLQMTYGTKECSFDPYINGLREVVREDSRRKAEEGGHSIPKA
ncbi:MAG: HD domain-containing protein [Lachnospiraceae bacterium]|nr:HD domain-containing protein [Lachnospiraceae bacterium]